MRKTKTQISFAVTADTAKLISAFVFDTWIVQYLYFLNPKFPASSHMQQLYSLVCVRPGQELHCWFSRVVAHMYCMSLHIGTAPMLMVTLYASFSCFTVHCIADVGYKQLFMFNAE